MFPNCLAASDKHKKPGQMGTDLGQKSRDFLTQDPQGSLLSKKCSVLGSHPQNRGMTSLTCQLMRLRVGGCRVGPSRCLQIPTLAVPGRKPGPVPKGRARRETPTLGDFEKPGVGSISVRRAPRPRSEGNSWMWTVGETSHNPHRGLTQADTPTCAPVHTGIPSYMDTRTKTQIQPHIGLSRYPQTLRYTTD